MKKDSQSLGPLQNAGLSNELGENRYYRVLSDIQRKIHNEIPSRLASTDRVATPINYRTEFFDGEERSRAVIFLLTNGCEWALSSGNGCIMCGHLSKQARGSNPIPADKFVRQFSNEFRKIDFRKHPLLNIFNNGSFLNDREIPPEARRQILRQVNENEHVRMVVLETRPEFVTPEKVLEVKELLPRKHVEVAIGLEMSDDYLRSICINKGFSLQNYDDAAAAITRHLHLRTYVFLKPPFLSERESIEQAAVTIRHAFRAGSTTVSLEACTVQEYTLMKKLNTLGLYSPPWLWSIIEVVKRCRKGGKLVVGLFQFFPSPEKVPYNCEQCSETVLAAIKTYNRTLERRVLSGLQCGCKVRWRKELETQPPPLEIRLTETLSRVLRD